ncbi:SDR family NAD(P)-dependent oxidoreductase [Acidovorax sp. JHL-9]|uniref:SDR family NAD(P)-dependent oxidoreductase n=1 Tax=Acidovorax sp. JHL-9 TaxID=1276756 RepID=UPI0004091C6F|nr:SDR family NAD(P)-dependent oxidoreductase [Acidovorax sp. JHL-9]
MSSSTHTNSLGSFDLADARILISGAAGGIGVATARLCSSLGAQLVLVDVAPTAALEAVAEGIAGVESVHSCDSSDRSAVEDLVSRLPAISGLVDAAGISPYDDDWMADDWNDTAFQRVIQVNLLGPINLVRATLPAMVERKHGRIVLCGSIAGWSGGLRAGPHYAASKGGVHALVRWFSQRAVAHGVTVNGVAPGPVASGMTRNQGYDGASYPMRRMGEPDEIASAIAFLCSPGASYTSGAILDVNGGTYLR